MVKMRTLSEIIEDVKSGKKPEYEELRYALLVYSFMFFMDHSELRNELLREKETPKIMREIKARNSGDMFRNALNKSPKEFVGWNNDPENPEYLKRYKLSEKLLDKFMEAKKT